MFLQCVALVGAIHRLTAHGLVEVHLVTVELGSVDTREEHASAHAHAACAAHARAVDHKRVERDGRRQRIAACGHRDELHHYHRAYGHALVVVLAAGLDKLLHQRRDHAVKAFGAVVGGYMQALGRLTHQVGIDQHIARLGADYHVAPYTVLRQPLDLRVDRCGADTAGHEQPAPAAQLVERHRDEVRRPSERTGEVGQRLAHAQSADLTSRQTYGLDDDRDTAFGCVVVGDRQGDSFAPLVGAHYDELAGQGCPRHSRRRNTHQPYTLGQHAFL